ncbi:cytochrome c oxidase assembly protein COX16-domain-containing protein [Halteromyces radiatus]|uniref:cytochrome c oxidase assembly protein COX16-domain-containing protein n=1 Tax=Halteromyces radiatus TaxID=101107 RepID=UPI0022207BBF|nr:cytochrome c oxidase assembly protein COX16-domain-containing protein [Halteromyces radiatus]KAI8099203.1 cytochrome c oxidase assembly protein COX16-domain-containing protein [Halteromyces radiatus]
MPTFSSKPFQHRPNQVSSAVQKIKKHPFVLFGLPFIAVIVGGSFGLAQLTQTRYDHRDLRHRKVAKEEALGMDKNRRPLSIQEEYFRLQAKTEEDWEQVRVKRPPGVDE